MWGSGVRRKWKGIFMQKQEISLDEKKKIMLNMLAFLHGVCENHEINYFLWDGSLLGAIRHKGFIPWDDDIDIAMRRQDYEKFIKIFSNEYINEKYELLHIGNTQGYYLSFAKLVDKSTILIEEVENPIEMGVYLDIFPLDNLGNNYEEAKKFLNKIRRLTKLLLLKNLTSNRKRSFYKNIIIKAGKIIAGLIEREKLILYINNICKKNSLVQSDRYVGNAVASTYGERDIMKKEWIENTILVPFETLKVFVPEEYDAILSHEYGEYMKFPPEDKRITHHSNKVWKK